MRFVTDGGQFGLLVSPMPGPDMFRFQVIIGDRIIGDDQPCILGSAMGELRNLSQFEHLGFDPVQDTPDAVVSALNSSEKLHDLTTLSIAESMDGWDLQGLIFEGNFILLAREYGSDGAAGMILRTMVNRAEYEELIETAYRYWHPLTSHGSGDKLWIGVATLRVTMISAVAWRCSR